MISESSSMVEPEVEDAEGAEDGPGPLEDMQ